MIPSRLWLRPRFSPSILLFILTTLNSDNSPTNWGEAMHPHFTILLDSFPWDLSPNIQPWAPPSTWTFLPLQLSCHLPQSCLFQLVPGAGRAQRWKYQTPLYISCCLIYPTHLSWLFWIWHFLLWEETSRTGLGKGRVCKFSPHGDRWMYIQPQTARVHANVKIKFHFSSIK